MAEHTTHSLSLSTTSHDTALCVILPNTLCGNINQLRELYDKAYELWPPHINLIYPFVAPESLPRAQEQIQAHFKNLLDLSKPKTVGLDEAGLFSNRKTDTIFLRESQDPSTSYLVTLRSLALQALGQSPSGCNLHLTIGQPEDKTLSARDFLLAKAELLPRLDFQVGALAILIRERMAGPESPCRMRLWGTIEVTDSKDAWRPVTPEYWTCQTVPSVSDIPLEESHEDDGHRESRAVVREGSTYYYNSQLDKWAICSEVEQNNEDATTVTVASYNVLIDSEYPPARDRETLLLRTMLSDSAMADILVLQEVSDDFLSYLLNDAEIQRRYPYTSHAPPSQVDVGPLPSLRNIVVLSRWAFNWRFVPFHRRHKGAVVALFGLNPSSETSEEQNLVIAGVHLTAGLTDGSVAAKRTELQRLTRYLKQNYNTEPWVVAGDFNITTSTYTIDTALKDKSITSHTKATLAAMEASISDAGLFDAWSAARVEAADDMGADNVGELFEGEDGATFDPRNNALAAGTTGTSHNRPQRYDRILVHPRKTFRIAHFNHFGQPQDIDGVHVVASDHNGIRASLEVLGKPDLPSGSHDPLLDLPFEHKRAIHNLSSTSDLKLVLEKHHMFPTNDEIQRWQHAFSVLKQAVLGVMDNAVSASSDIPLVLVPVGSYALGVWTSTSDVDCLCIGTISSKTFFKLVRQRLMRAENQGIRILRRVEANSGTMLELSVHGIDFDLQYCPAARVVERWSQFQDLAASDDVFNLSILSLRKLKPYRDLLYIQRTLPSQYTFRLAYRCIKLWAVQHGIYSSKFGYLGGVHITLMLSWVHKRIAHDSGTVSAGDLITSFFHHYAEFDWANKLVYDAFFHKKKPRYYRSAREPMAILGFHAPNSNIAHTSTVPGVQTLVKEFKAAAMRLSDPSMTWAHFAEPKNSVGANMIHGGEAEFLGAHDSYFKIDIQFWGRTLAKGKGLIGWVESRALSLVIEIHKALPALDVRIWPARFTDSDPSENGDYHGCYLIGLSKDADASFGNKDERQAAKQSLDKVADRFLERIRTDERNYDSEICWVGISLAKSSDLNGYRLDDREWGDYTLELDSDSDDEEEVDEDFDEATTSKMPRTIPQRPKPTAEPVSKSKLRPASDVLNRLRWDPNLDPTDYIVGYEDRFLGARETGLEKWKTEQTDEEFIPQHRILYFKKKGGDDGKGEVVWERATRVDRVFFSGAGAGAQ